jgi:NAD(P)-dependent dehydrogenase (short-subunit alcohol dehydrogenase family)
MKRNFTNKTIVVTGASGNLGTAICTELAKAGATIVGLDYNPVTVKELQRKMAEKGIDLIPVVCDITNKEACYEAAQKIMQQTGRIDGLINNAGITHIERYTAMDKSKEITRRVMEVNFFGAVNCTEAMLDQIIQNKGVIVNISSVAGFAPLLGRTAYAASKHALHGFFESLGAELQADGVHCLMVCPSFIQAPKEALSEASAAKNSIYQNKKTIGPTVSAATIATEIRKACIKGQKTLVMGRTGKLSYWARRIAPNFYEKKMINNLKDEI